MDPDKCLESIESVKKQLEEVGLLLNTSTGEDRKRLEQVQLDLITILELTVQQLELQNVSSSQKSESTHSTNMDEEFELFKAEIDKVTAENEDKNSENKNAYSSLINDLLALEGNEVRAPFIERWGGYSYHNAVILSIVHSDEESLLESPRASVLYSQPTSNEMVPCKFFLEDRCKFIEENCKYSHGNEVKLSSLKDYIVPDIQSINAGSSVLLKHDGELWHKGDVDVVLSDRSLFSVNCRVCNTVVAMKPEDMIPVVEEEISKQENESEFPTEPAIDENTTIEIVQTLSDNLNFGEWEKHTKGMGSKIMAQMGYVFGTGLGCRSEGRTDPVTTLVYPQGVSLDRCRELRIGNEGRCLLDVEKHMQKQQKKFDAQLKRQENNIRNDDVFDLINNKLNRKSGDSSSGGFKLDVSKSSLQKQTVQNLNINNLQLDRHIKTMTKEINKLENLKRRQLAENVSVGAIDKTLTEKKTKLTSLRAAEKAISREQNSRKDAKRSSIF